MVILGMLPVLTTGKIEFPPYNISLYMHMTLSIRHCAALQSQNAYFPSWKVSRSSFSLCMAVWLPGAAVYILEKYIQSSPILKIPHICLVCDQTFTNIDV